MDRLAAVVAYLLRDAGEFAPAAEEVRRAEDAVLLQRMGEILQEGDTADAQKLQKIIALLEEF